MRDPKPLMELLALRRLNLEKCKVESIRDIEPVLMNCRHLQASRMLPHQWVASRPPHRV